MNRLAQDATDFKEVNAAFDFFKLASKPWLDMIDGAFAKSDNEAQESGATWPALEITKLWSPWQNGIFKNIAAPKPETRNLFAACMEQQQRCSSLAMAWFTCSMKMMGAIQTGIQQRKSPAEILKACQESADEYCRSCTDFINSQCKEIFQAWRINQASEEAGDKAEVKKSRPQAKAPA